MSGKIVSLHSAVFKEVEDYIKYLAISRYFVVFFFAWYDMVSGSRIFSQIAENVASNI